jgi:hypothetical protein
MNRHFSLPHLSDEAVAAFADGVLREGPYARAAHHLGECPDCAEAVREQRQASFALRAAATPSLPRGLMDRLRDLPTTAELPFIPAIPSAMSPTGQPVFASYQPTRDSTPDPKPESTDYESTRLVRRMPGPNFGAGFQLPIAGLTAVAAATLLVGVLATTAASAGGSPSRTQGHEGHAAVISTPATALVNAPALLDLVSPR